MRIAHYISLLVKYSVLYFFISLKFYETLYFVADNSLLKDFQKLYASETGKPTFPVFLDSVEKNQEISPMRSIVYHQVAEKNTRKSVMIYSPVRGG